MKKLLVFCIGIVLCVLLIPLALLIDPIMDAWERRKNADNRLRD